MKLQFTFLLAALFWTISAQAQHQLLQAKIIDKRTQEPIEMAMINLLQAESPGFSDRNGNVALPLSTEDTTLSVVVSCIGYETREIKLSQTASPLHIELERSSIKLQEVAITANPSALHRNTLSRIDVNLKPVKSAQELMQIVSGLFIAQHAGGGKAEQIFLRGFDIDHGTDIDISVDGMPVNMVSHAHGQGYADLHFVIPETVRNIDYGKGPYYAEHGNFTTAGYVGFETLNKLSHSMIQVEAGRFNTYRTLAMVNLVPRSNTKHSAYIAAEYIYSDGPFISSQHFNRVNALAKYRFTPTENTTLQLTASTFASRWDASGQVPQRAVNSGFIDRFGAIDDKEGGNTKRSNVQLKWQQNLPRQKAWLEAQAAYIRYDFELFSNFTFFLDDPINGDQIKQKENRDIYVARLRYQQPFTIGKTTLTTSYGIGIRADRTHNSELSHTKNRSELLDPIQMGNISEDNAYAFADMVWQIGKWQINPAIRADFFRQRYNDQLAQSNRSETSQILSPKLTIQYQANKSLLLYLKTGKGFHANDTRGVVANNGVQTLPAAYGADLGLRCKPTSSLILTAAAWYLFLEQEFVYVGDAGVVEAGGRTRRTGIDLEARYQFTPQWFAETNINLAIGRDLDSEAGNNFIPLAPNLTSTGGIYYRPEKGLNGSLRYRYIKDRPANSDNTITAEGYFILDAAINYTQRRWEAGIVVENLLNSEWNEAQFDTESRLFDEPEPVSELHFTPGHPLFIKGKIAFFF